MEWLERAYARDPANVATLLAIVNVYQKLGRRELAYEFVANALKQGRPTAALMRIASMYQDDGRAEEAATHLREVLEKQQNHPNVLASLLISRTADDDKAIITAASAVIKDDAQLKAPRAAVAYALASAFDRSGRYDEVFAQAETANRLVRVDHPHDLEPQRQRYQRVMHDLMALRASGMVRENGATSPRSSSSECRDPVRRCWTSSWAAIQTARIWGNYRWYPPQLRRLGSDDRNSSFRRGLCWTKWRNAFRRCCGFDASARAISSTRCRKIIVICR
ncbi:tetratricopeptide repeat protein [Sphingomonas suaedae]|uniref:Tetratricopeptide repeat protein n=1 Tax=Sphingomonas suaedae TaxID=2599297 RepID=A0A518RHQ9_9SPHN|nr:tetratricopeptide repeat protein [Sphingomonas suaedae]QDX26983.1 tetratricopeptide repeat protein [Sphingomonas suaedae]